MGYWGPDIFESDYALCTLGELLDPFVSRINQNAANPDTSQWDEILIDELVISAKILMTLLEAGFPIEVFPERKILEKNREIFAQAWRKNAGENAFQLERLAVILSVWDQMISACKKKEAEGGERQLVRDPEWDEG